MAMVTGVTDLRDYKWTTLYGKTEGVIADTEKTDEGLWVNLKVTCLSM